MKLKSRSAPWHAGQFLAALLVTDQPLAYPIGLPRPNLQHYQQKDPFLLPRAHALRMRATFVLGSSARGSFPHGSGPRRGVCVRLTSGRPSEKCRSTGSEADGVLANQSPTLPTSEGTWERWCLLRRQLEAAVAQENFERAAQLRDESKALAEQLPPIQQYLFHQLERLRTGTLEEQRAAVSALGEAGDASLLPELAACLLDPALAIPAHEAMWQIFLRCSNLRVSELMAEGIGYMSNSGTYEKALALFGEVIAMEPTFAEGYNKRATVLYLMMRYRESIEDCKIVLHLNPHHFGAASGMGLCYVALAEHRNALEAFETALAIHPGLSQIRQYVEALRETIASGGDEVDPP